ncbi:MAG: flagellar hook-basal body complex protein FliE [Planctomycetota bacterium]
MSDPLGLIGGVQGGGAVRPGAGAARAAGPKAGDGPDFKNMLIENLREVNAAQQDADRAVEDLVSGRRSDLEGVILASEKADGAFKMLQAMRNKVLDAYEEIRQTRV